VLDVVGHGSIGLGLGQVEQFAALRQRAVGVVQRRQQVFEPGLLAAQFLRARGVVPDRGVFQLGIDFGQALLALVVLKDSPAARRSALTGRPACS
jgi:hypothetical protein